MAKQAKKCPLPAVGNFVLAVRVNRHSGLCVSACRDLWHHHSSQGRVWLSGLGQSGFEDVWCCLQVLDTKSHTAVILDSSVLQKLALRVCGLRRLLMDSQTIMSEFIARQCVYMYPVLSPKEKYISIFSVEAEMCQNTQMERWLKQRTHTNTHGTHICPHRQEYERWF